MLKRFCYVLFLLPVTHHVFSQNVITGKVEDGNGKPIFAANVYFKSHTEKGTTTDFDGFFSLSQQGYTNDTLVISYIGHETKEIPVLDIDFNTSFRVVLREVANELAQITIQYTDPISEQFSITKMEMLEDVYLNPVAQGDPLKAITILPASTNADETAQVELRGSSAGKSRVIFNGVPIINPVRASSLNNQGFFSLFNPEIIQKQYVYAGNPPLTFGNSSAGLVEIETRKKLDDNELQVSLSLASSGFLLSQSINEKKSFIQAYGNYQFSDAYVGIQEKQFPNIRSFSTLDGGLNFHGRLGSKAQYNSFNYLIREEFDGKDFEEFTYTGDVITDRTRFFSVNNVTLYTNRGILTLNNGMSVDKNTYQFGNRYSNSNYKNIFTSFNYKWLLIDNTDIQFGVSHEYHNHIFKDTIPTFFYALSPQSPKEFSRTDISNNILEAYIYTLWDINPKWSFSSGMRSNIPVNDQEYYFSSQMSFKFKPNNYHHFLLSGGRYHSYSTPNYFNKSYELGKSFQIALEQNFQKQKTHFKSAVYFKSETEEQQSRNDFFALDRTHTFGVELSLDRQVYKYLNISLANTFIDQKVRINDNDYSGENDFNYFFKGFLKYNNPKIFTISFVYQSRPGRVYNSITNGVLRPDLGFYEPQFFNEFYDKRYEPYHRFDISISKFISLNKNALVFFASANNIFNQKNQRIIQYNRNYTQEHFNHYQYRNIYFGVVWHI